MTCKPSHRVAPLLAILASLGLASCSASSGHAPGAPGSGGRGGGTSTGGTNAGGASTGGTNAGGRLGAAGSSSGGAGGNGGSANGGANPGVGGQGDAGIGGSGPGGSAGGGGSQGAPYPCLITSASGDGSLVDAGLSTVPPETCAVGSSYCFVLNGRSGLPTTANCLNYVDTDHPNLAVCTSNPTCECLCANGYYCRTTCRCSEVDGFATMNCDRV